jgi:type IV pilus assembly protein PilA
MLARIRKAQEERDGGFTLIELLVVIIIIGILAAIAIPVFLNQRKKATESSVKSDLRSVATEMETAFTSTGTYPAALPASAKTSTGNTVSVLAHATDPTGAFCLQGANVDASITVWFYDSANGGLTTTDYS